MKESFNIDGRNYEDLSIYYCGTEDCKSGHSEGSAVKDHYLIHYISNGKGIFQCHGKYYSLEKGQGFVIYPDIATYLEADNLDPWSYYLLGFHGLKADLYLRRANLTVDKPIYQYKKDDYIKDCFDKMIEADKAKKSGDIRSLGIFYQLLSKLIEEAETEFTGVIKDDGMLYNKRELYIDKSIEFIKKNYSRKITIEEISSFVDLDRSYLCSLFKKFTGISPKEYLNNFRIENACKLMQNENLSIGDISRSVGYKDPLLFSKLFKIYMGVSPSDYRLKNASSGKAIQDR